MAIRFDRWVDSVTLDLLEAGAGDISIDGYLNAKTVPFGMLAQATTGHYELVYDGIASVASPGTVMFAPPMTPVEVTHRVDPQQGVMAFRFAHLRFTLWGGVDVFSLMRPRRVFADGAAAEIGGLIQALLDLDTPSSPIERLARRQEIAFGLLRLLAGGAELQPNAAEFLEGRNELLPVLRLLRERFTEPWTVDQIATAARTSRASLHRQFLRIAGMSPIEYVRRLRLDDAAWRLMNTPASVAQVATGVGYANQFHFSREFSRRFGASPSVYRRDRVFGELRPPS